MSHTDIDTYSINTNTNQESHRISITELHLLYNYVRSISSNVVFCSNDETLDDGYVCIIPLSRFIPIHTCSSYTIYEQFSIVVNQEDNHVIVYSFEGHILDLGECKGVNRLNIVCDRDIRCIVIYDGNTLLICNNELTILETYTIKPSDVCCTWDICADISYRDIIYVCISNTTFEIDTINHKVNKLNSKVALKNKKAISYYIIPINR